MAVRMVTLSAACFLASCAGTRDDGELAQLRVESQAAPVVEQELDPAAQLEQELKLVERLTARIEMLRAQGDELLGYGYQREPEVQRRQWERRLSDFDLRLLDVEQAGAITTPTALRRLREDVLLPLDELRRQE